MTCPAFCDPGPTPRKARLFALEYAEILGFIGSQERGWKGGVGGYRVARKISRTKVGVSVCWGLRTMAAFCQPATSKVL